jgi:hypothetical protein
LMDSAHRMSIQQRLTEEIANANEDFQIKDEALKREIDALDKNGMDYENKLQALHDKEIELTQQHEDQITAIQDKAAEERNSRVLGAYQHFNEEVARASRRR